ncbi:MAG: NAD-dependent epimerase/dehydratase family protein [candidate division KSB1 bacterium]|nr:NAD-dependent epimerase/dehydratase family protein [candidate division KSB1 bacterium]
MPRRAALPEIFAGKKVMITGGLGFIGSNLAHRLVAYGAEVLIVDSLIPDYGGNLFNIHGIEDKVCVNIADVRDQYSMRYLVRGQDYIFNLAGQVSHIDSMNDPFTDLEINCRAQLSILEACRHNNPHVKIVFAGTRQQYGKPDYLPVDEKHLQHPTDVNGINKMAGEWYHILYNNVYGIRAASLRLTNTYGPRQLIRHDRQGFISVFIRKILDNETILIFGDGKQIRDFTYVEDVVDAFLLTAAYSDCDGQIFNLGGDEPMRLIDLVKLMIEIAGQGSYKLVPFPPEKKRIDIGDYYGDYRRIYATLGWKYRVTLREGLAKTFEFYRKYGEHYR